MSRRNSSTDQRGWRPAEIHLSGVKNQDIARAQGFRATVNLNNLEKISGGTVSA